MAPLRRAQAHLSLALGLLLAVALQASQQLAIADELHRHKQQAPAHYRNQQQQQQQQQRQQPHAAQSNAAQNDLVPPPDTPASFTFSAYNNFRPQRHIQAEGAPEGGRAVINGNRATYVEPPADFTPIIYEPLAASGRPGASPFEEPAESFDSPNQLLLATGAAASASQRPRFSSSGAGIGGQQPPPAAGNSTREQEPPAAMVMGGGGGGALEGAGEQALDDNEQALPLKPSVGRWSDWHDMSIEPDLAASDSQPEASALGPQAYRTRYGAPSADGAAITAPAGSAGSGAPKSAGGRASAAAADEPRPVRLLPLKVELQQAAQPQQPQQLEQPQRAHSFSGNLIRMQQAPGVEYALAANQFQYHRAAQFAPTHLRPLYLVSPALEHPPPSPMHFLIAHNHHYQQQQQQQQQLQQPRQFQQFAFAANQLEPVRGAPWLAASSGSNEISALPMPARANCAERPSKNLFVRRLMLAPAAKRHRKAPQVERKNAEVRLIPATGSSAPAGGKPVALAALAPPPPPAQLASGPKAAGANSSAPAAAGKPRLLKRRRIVSTRPVGLSSWFLGGMRDLDARFWKLPAELLNKLAVNDVDLAHPEELGGGGGNGVFSSIAPGAHEPEAIAASGKPSELELAGPPLASTAPPRNLAAPTRPIK